MCIKTGENEEGLVEESIIQEDMLKSVTETINTLNFQSITISLKQYGIPVKAQLIKK